VSEATGAAQNQGRPQVTGRGGTSGSGAKRSTTMQPNSDGDAFTADAVGSARDDATAEIPVADEVRDTAPPPAHPTPPSARPAPESAEPAMSAGAEPPPGDRGWRPRPPAAPPEPPQWTSTVQPSGTAVNRPASPYGPTYGPSEAPPAPPAPTPPPAAPPPGRQPGGLRGGRAVVTRARAAKRAAAGKTTNGKAPRRAHLQVSRFEPWSVMKFSFVMALVCFVVLLVAVTVLYMILSGLGVFEAISNTINDLTREQGARSGGLDAATWFSFTRVFGYTALIGSLNVMLITALATVWAVIYNLAADFVGGVEVTLKEAE
jgi:Transmembrane domain of unknown function (DUF3566)